LKAVLFFILCLDREKDPSASTSPVTNQGFKDKSAKEESKGI
jgi:hypothetical protein